MGQLLEAIADPANVEEAWARVRATAGAAGIDGQSVAAFDADVEHQLAALRRRLLSAERYVPPPVLRAEIPKPDGRMRPLGIPTVADRVVQQATRQVIEPFFETKFLACSLGSRPGKGAKKAAFWVKEAIRPPLLANIYLHRLDVEVREAGLRLIGYADDFVVLTRTEHEARAADALVRQILADIGLEVAEAKSGVRRVSEGFDFLGFTYHERFLRPRSAAVKRFKDEVRARTRRQAPVSLQHMIEDLNPLLRGWGSYFAIGDVVSLFGDLDGWIRTRLRSKVRGSAARLISRQKLPNRTLGALGLVSLEPMARAERLSPG